jgi:hypothetical protein
VPSTIAKCAFMAGLMTPWRGKINPASDAALHLRQVKVR